MFLSFKNFLLVSASYICFRKKTKLLLYSMRYTRKANVSIYLVHIYFLIYWYLQFRYIGCLSFFFKFFLLEITFVMWFDVTFPKTLTWFNESAFKMELRMYFFQILWGEICQKSTLSFLKVCKSFTQALQSID